MHSLFKDGRLVVWSETFPGNRSKLLKLSFWLPWISSLKVNKSFTHTHTLTYSHTHTYPHTHTDTHTHAYKLEPHYCKIITFDHFLFLIGLVEQNCLNYRNITFSQRLPLLYAFPCQTIQSIFHFHLLTWNLDTNLFLGGFLENNYAIGGWKCNFPSFFRKLRDDRPTNRPTNRRI